MAIDRKADYVGTHGGAYVDDAGARRQFTYIDHDPKPKISTNIEDGGAKEKVKSDRADMLSRLLAIPAVFCSSVYQEDFTLRGENPIAWNKRMLEDEGLPYDKLRDIYILALKKQEMHKKGITP